MPKRPLTKGEKQKIIIFAGIIFLLANLLGLQNLAQSRQKMEMELTRLRAEQNLSQAWLGEKELWTQRGEWLTKNQPPLVDPSQANVQLLESLQALAKTHNLTILEQNLQEPRREPYFYEAAVQLRLTGSLESVCKWLAELQQPAKFHAITNFSLKADADAKKVRCDLRIARWHLPVPSS